MLRTTTNHSVPEDRVRAAHPVVSIEGREHLRSATVARWWIPLGLCALRARLVTYSSRTCGMFLARSIPMRVSSFGASRIFRVENYQFG